MPLRLRRNALLGAVLTAALCLVALPSDTTRARAAAAQVTQEGTTTLSAPVVQQGRRPTSSENARLTGTVRFSPERKGRPVVVQRRMGARSWQRVTVKRQDGSGKVAFAGRAYNRGGEPYEYRGVARRYGGLSAQASTPRSAEVWAPVFTDEFNRRQLGDRWRRPRVRCRVPHLREGG